MNYDAKVIRCSNENMYVKMERLKHIILNANEDIRMSARSFPDAAVLAEMSVMGTTSMKCDHCPSKHTDVMSFERPIPDKVPTYIEDMSMCMTANSKPIKNVRVRHNPVTAAIISDCISMLEFMDRFNDKPEDVAYIMLATYPSVTHAATISYVFECISSYAHWDGVVSLNILVSENTRIAMNAYVGPRLNVNLVECQDQVMYLIQMMEMHTFGYMTVITHDAMCSRMLLTKDRRPDLDINLVMCMDTIESEQLIRSTCLKKDMLTEMCPCSDPKLNMVRIVPVARNKDPCKMTTKIKHMFTPSFGYMRWYTVMIRRMKVDKICYDCSIALKLAYALLYLMSDREMDMTEMTDKYWTENFETYMNVQELLE